MHSHVLKGQLQLKIKYLLIYVSLLGMSSTSTSLAATLTVNSLADDTVSGDGLVTLREAVIAAVNDTTNDLGQTGTANDVIDLTGLSGTIVLGSPMPTINQSVIFDGPGAEILAIDGDKAHQFLDMDNAAVVNLTGLTIRNCHNTINGGAISTRGSLSAAGCIFEFNRSVLTNSNLNSMGSAIYGDGSGSSIQLHDCVIADNIGEVQTSAFLYFVGAAVGTRAGSIIADKCIFERNSTLTGAPSTGGGGMGHSLGSLSGGNISLRNSTIKEGFFKQPLNFSGWGSVYIGPSGCLFNAQNCTWTGNTGYPCVGVYTIGSSSIPNNLQLVNCTFSENGDLLSGAMVLCNGNSGANMAIEHCTFTDNVSRSNLPASLEVIGSSAPPVVQIRNTVMASADADKMREEIRSGFGFTSNGYNFISNPGSSVPSQPDMTYASTGFDKVSEIASGLTINGGLTRTCSLPAGSPLIDAANPAGFAATDQRDVARPRNGDDTGGSAPDIGAYERFNGNLKTAKTVNRTQASNGSLLEYIITVTNEHMTETASGIEVTDLLPPNLVFQGISSSTFSSVEHIKGSIMAKCASLSPGASVSVTIDCTVAPYKIINTASATQLGYEETPEDNTAMTSTVLLTPPVPRVVEFVALGNSPTSATELQYRLRFDQSVTGVDATDFSFIPSTATASIAAVASVDSLKTYSVDVDVSSVTDEGPFALQLEDYDGILSEQSLEPLAGIGAGGETSSTVIILDKTAPVSVPVAAAVSPGETTTTKFFLLYNATDANGIAGVDVYFRKGDSDPFLLLPGGPYTTGHAEIDTALYSGYGTYQIYTRGTDTAGNKENKLPAPEIIVTLSPGTPSAALHWELYQ